MVPPGRKKMGFDHFGNLARKIRCVSAAGSESLWLTALARPDSVACRTRAGSEVVAEKFDALKLSLAGMELRGMVCGGPQRSLGHPLYSGAPKDLVASVAFWRCPARVSVR